MSLARRSLVIGLVLATGCGGTKWSGTTAPPATARPGTPITVVTAPQGWVSYRDPSGLSLQHPPAWTTQSNPPGPVFVFVDDSAATGGFRRNINILSQTIPSGTTAADYLRISLSQIASTGGTMEENSDVTLDGHAGHELIWRVYKAQRWLRFLSRWTLRTKAAYIVTYSADDANFDAPLADVRRLIASIRLPPSA
jgi:hypothetical protein